MQNQTPPPAGWYPDPSNASAERWWDGSSWTDHARPIAQTPPPPAWGTQPGTPQQYGYAPQGQQYGQPYGYAPQGQQYGQQYGYGQQASFAAPPVGFAEAIKRGFTMWTISGRASRSEFWYWILFNFLFGLVLGAVTAIVSEPGSPTETAVSGLSSLVNLFFAVATLKISIRRYHDVGKGGGWIAALLGGFVAGIILIFVGAGTAGLGAVGGNGDGVLAGGVIALVGLIGLAVTGIWNFVIHCQQGKPERNKYDS